MQNDCARSNNGPIGAGTSRLALYLSALVFPGAGQFAQRRWLAGLFYTVSFSVCFIFLVIAIFAPMFWNLRLAIEFADTGKGDVFRPISFAKIFLWLGLSVLVYFTGVLDTFIYYRRQCRRQREAGLQEKTAEGLGQNEKNISPPASLKAQSARR